MRKGNHLVEQFNGQEIVIDFDQVLTKSEFQNVLTKFLKKGDLRMKNNELFYLYGSASIELITKNITYLGNPHPRDKKRIQISKNVKVKLDSIHSVLIGTYYYESILYIAVFPSFDYVFKRINNSSAHVIISDFVKASQHDFFTRIDKMNNFILVFKADFFEPFMVEYMAQLNISPDIEEISQWMRERFFTQY